MEAVDRLLLRTVTDEGVGYGEVAPWPGFPTETIGRLNQYGYRLAPYAAAQTGFAAKGAAITLSQSDAKAPNTGTVTVTGPDAETIDTIAFALSLTDDANAATAKQRLTDIVRAFQLKAIGSRLQ